MFKYNISVIIPIYNAEKYLENSIISLLNQKYDLTKIQIILVNDGSNDNSASICQKYYQAYDNILYLEQENHGVSNARNNGIKNALGKYIMFLDADDTLSPKTIINLWNFFEKHYDAVDLVTYPISIIQNNKIKNHYRNDLYQRSQIYDLNDYPFIGQTTINIIIKNKFEDNLLFNTEFSLREDEDFNTRLLMQKQKIGFCATARYFYKKHGDNVSLNLNHPYYCFEHILNYDENLIAKYQKNGKVPKYIQALILNSVRWRIVTNQLFPYHYNEKEYNHAIQRMKKMLANIETQTIMEMPTMDFYHKFYLINFSEKKINLKYKNQSFQLVNNGKEIYSTSEIEIVINKFNCTNKYVEILGYIKSPLTYYAKTELIVVTQINSEIKEEIVQIFNSNWSFYKSKIRTANFVGFQIELPKDKLKNISFKVKINNHPIKVKYIFTTFAPFNKKYNMYSFVKQHLYIKYNGVLNQFDLKKISILQEKIYIYLNIFKTSLINPKAGIYKLLARKYANNTIWLYSDRNGIFDNAYYQFQHDFKKNDGIQRYYIIDDNFTNVSHRFTEEEHPYVINYKTLKHKLLFLNAVKILSSFQSVTCYSPFKNGLKWYRDIVKYQLIYLQHGVLHANLVSMYSNEKNEIDKIVISSEFEKNNFINNYNYTVKNLLPSGMPRFDMVDINKKADSKIVFAPTWRENLIGKMENNRRRLKEAEFLKSDYYIKINNLLKSKKLNELLKKNNYTFDLKLHPIFKDYLPLFEKTNKYIKVSADEIKLDEYKLFITDYSSFIFDYLYLKRPVIYFIPDEVILKAGLHTYRQLDLPLEEGFGDVIYDETTLIQKIEYFIKNDFKIEKKYAKRMEDFFIVKNNHCETLYNLIIEEDQLK